MINALFNLLKIIIAILPFVLLCFLSKKVNLPKPDRSKQFAMPVISLIYVVTSMFLVNKVCEWLLSFINNIPKWIAAPAKASWMPDFIGNIFKTISNAIDTFLSWFNLNYWIFFIANVVIILVYIFFKKICIALISKIVKNDGNWHTKIADKFYEFFTEKNKWCIRENFVQVRSLLKVFYYSAVVLSAILTIVSNRLYKYDMLESLFYPVFGIIVVGEIYFYLDGTTKKEYSEDILGEDEEAYKVVNYSLLRKFLRSVFGDKLLTENTDVNNAFSYDITTEEIIEELEKSEDPKVVSFATYFDALNKTGFAIDHNYLHSSLEMLNGKSMLFNNPFYNDLIPYAFYPMNRTLLSHKKVLVVAGRHSVEEDVKTWCERGIEAVTNIPFMWNIGVLSTRTEDIDIGIVTRSDVLNIELHNANADFLENVGFVVILEPSKLIATAQIGLNLLVKRCNASEENVVYCMCDQNCDGLVDAMSHILMTNITEVSATKKHQGTCSYMCWSADDEYLHHRLVPNISRYLGMGTELSFAALKNQVSKTKWYGGEAFPVADMRWIAKQYYYDLTKYASLPTSQEALDEHFQTTSNFWSAETDSTNYITVEDESNNMFEILRDFSTRTTEQGFINVISSDYLLKDYMADNASIFEADPKAIPYIVADYTRSNRNTVLRLILMMSTYPISSDILEKEFSLLGINVFNLKKQIWYELYHCYAEISDIESLPDNYEEAVREVSGRAIKLRNMEIGIDIIKISQFFNINIGALQTMYSIVDTKFIKGYVSELKSAGYIAEDEKGQKNYLGAELCGHVYQKYLPGQFFTFGGKYYQMQYLTADGQVLVRRAADHINGRQSYRQVREYVIHNTRSSDKIGACQNISGLKIIKEFADISVKTPGYYGMDKYNDFKNAKSVTFEGDKNGIPVRSYRNKEILRIELPEKDGKLTDNIRYTIAVLFNEIFKTVFAENQSYISAVTDDSFVSENRDPLTYSLTGDGYEIKKNCIYIIEDSQLDLGLIVAVERNLERFFKIVYDFLDWHTKQLEESLYPTPEPTEPIVFEEPSEEGEKKKEKGIIGFFKKIGRAIGNFFKKIGGGIAKFFKWFIGLFKKKKKDSESEVPADETAVEVPENDIPESEQNPITGDGVIETQTEEITEASEGEEPASEPVSEPEIPEEKPKKKGIFGIFGRNKNKREKVDSGEKATENPETDVASEKEDKPKKKGIFGIFGKKKKNAEPETAIATEEAVDETISVTATENDVVSNDQEISELPEETTNEVVSDTVDTLESPAVSSEVETSDDDPKIGYASERKPYHERYYTLYGGDSEPSNLELKGVLEYLATLGMDRNPLKQAREGKNIAEFVEATFKPGRPDARYCDFCGAEIYGVEYETLVDGRDRCLNCGRTAIKTGEEFRKIFEDVKRNMEAFFGIRINAGIKVEMVNSKTLHKRLGKAFIPTPDSDGRILGVAISDKNGYSLLVENGSPRMASMLTMAHELTHIWQYINWKDKNIKKKYGKELRLEVYEGMAKWVEIQYAYLINEPAVAKREEIITENRRDEYGLGFLRYRANYPFSRGTVITKPTPFLDVETPLSLDYCGEMTFVEPEENVNDGNGSGAAPKSPAEAIKGPSNRNPATLSRYAYGLLDENEKAVYDSALSIIKNFGICIELTEQEITSEQAQKIVDYIQRDHPELFWFRQGATYYFDTETKIVSKIDFVYCMTREEAAERQEKIDIAVKPFLTSVNSSMSDYEVTLRIYENIIDLVDYDTIGLENQTNEIKDPAVVDDLRSIYGVFVNRKAVCAGYAKATQYLLNLCGIECTYVTSDTHAWNLIKLEGEYYHLDTTWGDGTDTKKEKNQSVAINYDLFCITTDEVLKLESHTPDPSFPLPECTETACNYHRRHGLFFEKYDYDRLVGIVCKSIDHDRMNITLKFADDATFAEAKKMIIDGGKFRDALQYSNLKSAKRVGLSYVYTCEETRHTMSFHLTKA